MQRWCKWSIERWRRQREKVASSGNHRRAPFCRSAIGAVRRNPRSTPPPSMQSPGVVTMVDCSGKWWPEISREKSKLGVGLRWTVLPTAEAHHVPCTHGFLHTQAWPHHCKDIHVHTKTDLYMQTYWQAGRQAGRHARTQARRHAGTQARRHAGT